MDTLHPRRGHAWPARLDVVQSASGLLLALFMWFHMAFVSTILVSKDAFWTVARIFEGEFLFGEPIPALVSFIVALVWALVALHALLALRKLPADWRQYRGYLLHTNAMRHSDTQLWSVHVVTGIVMLFLASIHLYTMMIEPEAIGPYGSADQVWSGRTWPLLLVLLLCVEIHGVTGLYRLALKWGWPTFGSAARTRRILRRLMWGLMAFFILLGLTTLLCFVSIGRDHADRVGERYVPQAAVSPGGSD